MRNDIDGGEFAAKFGRYNSPVDRLRWVPIPSVESFEGMGCRCPYISWSGVEVDRLVYNLCGLREYEIGAVEGTV